MSHEYLINISLTHYFILSPQKYAWLAPKTFGFRHQGDPSGVPPNPPANCCSTLVVSRGPSDAEYRRFSELTCTSENEVKGQYIRIFGAGSQRAVTHLFETCPRKHRHLSVQIHWCLHLGIYKYFWPAGASAFISVSKLLNTDAGRGIGIQ